MVNYPLTDGMLSREACRIAYNLQLIDRLVTGPGGISIKIRHWPPETDKKAIVCVFTR